MGGIRTGIMAVLAIATAHAALADRVGDQRWAERFARWFSPELRRIDTGLASLATELRALPELAERPFAFRYGFRSEILLEPDVPQWLSIDLGREERIDTLLVVPVHIPTLGPKGMGYGFPLRFKIEVADSPDMAGAVTVVDRTTADVPHPGRNPMIFRIPPVTGRHVRFTSTRHTPSDQGYLWAIEELMLLRGNQTLGKDLPITASSSLELFPNWSAQRANDGMSALGLPVTVEPSPSRGYLSALTDDLTEKKWLVVDLERQLAVDEIRLVPVQPENFESLGEKSFPRAWSLELAVDAGFESVTWRHEQPRTNVTGYPGDCAVVQYPGGARGRFIRVAALDMWGVADKTGFGLAEIQAYSDGVNVALGRPVSAKDAADASAGAGWAPQFVVDGFSSRRKLVEIPEYLGQIERRMRLEAERALLLDRRGKKIEMAGLILGYGGGGFGLAAAIGCGWLLVRHRMVQRQAVARLRDQIARDLHDDIGSNLGGIVLLSEMGSRHSSDPKSREEFAAIKEAAEETSNSMQDIVWLIGRGNTSLRDLINRMRRASQVILGDSLAALTVDPPAFRDCELSLLFRRHVLFAFKETLNNVRRHASATAVEVCVTIQPAHLTFTVRDNGVGFDPPAEPLPGHGLGNLSRRAARLGGSCRIASRPGEGAAVEFHAPLKS